MTKNSRSDRNSQKETFVRTARELGCDEDPDAFARTVKRLAKAPPPIKRPRRDKAKPEG